MAFEFVGIELFTKYDLFGNGLMGFAFQMFLWGLIIYSVYRPFYKNPFEKGLEVLLPSITISFIMTFFGFGPLLIGLTVFIFLLISIKYYDGKMGWHPFLTLSIQFTTLLWIFANAREYSLLLFFIYVAYNLVNGQLIINKNKKKEKK